MTKLPNDRYIDSSRIIRELSDAEEKCQLDGQGVLDELARATAHCDRKARYHGEAADAYMLARAAYFAEAHRRTVMSPTETALNAQAAKSGMPSPVAKAGFKDFCSTVGVSRNHASFLVKIGNDTNPAQALKDAREYRHPRRAAYAKKARQIVDEVQKDPLSAIKKLWARLSPVQKKEFLSWALKVGE